MSHARENLENASPLLVGVTAADLPTVGDFADETAMLTAVNNSSALALKRLENRDPDAMLRLDLWPTLVGAGAVTGRAALWVVRPGAGGTRLVEPLASLTFVGAASGLDYAAEVASGLGLTSGSRKAATVSLTDYGLAGLRTGTALASLNGDAALGLGATLTVFDRGPAVAIIAAIARGASSPATSVGLLASAWR